MKANKNIILILGLTLVLSNNISYASEGYPNQINYAIEENNADTSSDKLADEIVKEKEKLINYIEDFKKSSNYLDSTDQIRILYDNAIVFNSRALDHDNYEWLIFSINNLKEDIKLIEILANSDYQNKEVINFESKYFNNPLFKIAYLKLDKSEQNLLDEIGKENEEKDPLKISDFTKTGNENILIFFSDWLYPFMDDEDNDGVIASSQVLLDAIKEDEFLFETYRNTSYDERNILYDNLININDDIDKSNLNLINLLTTNYQNKQLNDEDLVNNNDKSAETSHVPETVVLSEDDHKDIDDSEPNKVISENIEKTNDFKDSDTEYNEDHLIDEKSIQFDDSIFSRNEKTREAYAKLTDEQKQTLNEMNTDGKYPLTIAEVKKSGLFKIPVNNDVWIYPFMIDKNNNGQVGEYDGKFDDMDPGESSSTGSSTSDNYAVNDSPQLINENEIYTNPTPIENNLVTSSPEPVNYTPATGPSIKTVQYYNVKTGIRGLKPVIIVLIAGSISYYFMKKNSKNKK